MENNFTESYTFLKYIFDFVKCQKNFLNYNKFLNNVETLHSHFSCSKSSWLKILGAFCKTNKHTTLKYILEFKSRSIIELL